MYISKYKHKYVDIEKIDIWTLRPSVFCSLVLENEDIKVCRVRVRTLFTRHDFTIYSYRSISTYKYGYNGLPCF